LWALFFLGSKLRSTPQLKNRDGTKHHSSKPERWYLENWQYATIGKATALNKDKEVGL
jgi:hypothetical protein